MKRKLIKQGVDTHTISLPIKWVRKCELKAGDDITIHEHEGNLVLSNQATSKAGSKININVHRGVEERGIGVLISNAYTAGFDKIIVEYEGNPKLIQSIADRFLLGFDVFQEGNTYSLESVTEPSYDNFENIIRKQFFILLEMTEGLGKKTLLPLVNKVKQYNNFLKRSIMKNK